MNDSEITGRVLIVRILQLLIPLCLDNYTDYFGTRCRGDHKDGNYRKQRLVVHSLQGLSFRFLLSPVHVAHTQSTVSHTGHLDFARYDAGTVQRRLENN